MKIENTELLISTTSGEFEDKTSVRGPNDTFYIYLYVSLVLVFILVCLKACLVYSAKKKRRDSANTSQTTNRCRRNQQITTISGDLEVVTSSAPTNPRDKFTDLPPTYDEAVKVHLSAFPTEPAPAYTAAPEEPSIPTDSLEIQQRV